MPDITQEKIEELRGLLAKATPGPWLTHLVDDTTIISPDREVGTTCDSSHTEREDGYNIEYERMEADAALIVAMRNALPDLLALASQTIASRTQAGDVEGLLIALASYQQADADGVMVTVSRQACDEAADLIRTLSSRVEEAKRAKEEAEIAIAWANNSLYGSHSFFLNENGGDANPHHLDEPIEKMKAYSREQWRCAEAAESRSAALARALEKLILDYVNLLEIGRDRIVDLGGQCDPVDVMERSDPALSCARTILEAPNG